MTSTRFLDRNVQDCGAWKERVVQEEKQARFLREALAGARAWNDGGDGSGAYALPHPVQPRRPPPYGGPRAVTSSSVSDSRSWRSSAVGSSVSERSKGSKASGGTLSKGLAEVSSRLARLETTLEKERQGRRGVQHELRQLRSMLSEQLGGRVSSSKKTRSSDRTSSVLTGSELPRIAQAP
eukprot:TRINITY_DN10298_c0_g2_i1.p1 TRINITY_DN10298_c0_g2~~TRINITY_DN10298_c0_g2_i1.p1  ORF type:complete len:181 (+),score=46.12 TRINITY_DN10298_c0_g2_i1:124-666(+)